METQATAASVPNPTSKSQNADKNSKLDRYKAADNADKSRYEKMCRSYASVRKIAQKTSFFKTARVALPSAKAPLSSPSIALPPPLAPLFVRAIALCYSPAKS